ncbi:MAG: hypothetical protein J5J00_16485, partial [Deltaproteobacteria bacterium]|nr:hypothetical protein [Deltaproteobacteria bacterium]
NTSYDDTSTVFYAEDPETLLASSSNLNVDYQNVIAAGEANSLAIQYNSQAVIAKGDQIVSLSSLADAKRDESAYYQDLIDNFQGDSAEPAPGLTAGEFAALSYRPSEEEVEAVEVLASSLSKATDTKVAGTEFTEKVRADSVKIDQQILNERDATALASDVAGRIVKDPKIGLQAVLNNLDPAKLDVASLLTDTILDGSSSVGIRRR